MGEKLKNHLFNMYLKLMAETYTVIKIVKQINNTLSTEGPMRNLVKIAQAVSEKKTS